MSNNTTKLGLEFDFNAFIQLQEKYGIDVTDKKSLDKVKFTLVVARQFVWAGLLLKNPEVTLEDAGKRIGSMANFGRVTGEIIEALTKSFTGK